MTMEDKLLPKERWRVEIVRCGITAKGSRDDFIEAFDRLAPCPPGSDVRRGARATWWRNTMRQFSAGFWTEAELLQARELLGEPSEEVLAVWISRCSRSAPVHGAMKPGLSLALRGNS
jgi:hypothetical protein